MKELNGHSHLEEFEVPEKPARKRIRDNHNELERVRRNNQKAQLEALRMALPFQDMDEKASMVSIFIRAREYIGMLEHRIIELQMEAGIPADRGIQLFNQTSLQQSPQQLYKQNFSPRQRQLSVNPDQVQIHHGIPFFNPGFMSSTSNIDMSALVTPISSPISNIQKPPSPLSDQHLNADILRSFVSDNFIKNGAVQRLSANEESNFLKDFRIRRSSSLILPFEDETVMIQKRDSLSMLFSGLLPDFIDTSAFTSSGDIKCYTCHKGMCNMIMIDCDRCHKWYHIKCARIDSGFIPTHWTCCNSD